MPARFEKVPNLFDGFDPKTVYQMVPVGGIRGGLSAFSDREEIVLTFDPPNIARFSGAKSFQPPTPLPFSDDSIGLAPNSKVTFELVALKAGNTTLVMRNRQGQPVGGLLISVKALVEKNYALCRLSDMRNNCPWPAAGLLPMMQGVEKTFLQQANVKLSQRGGQIFEVNVNDRDLGDPLMPERIVQPDNVTLQLIILQHAPAPAILAHFTIFFTWNLVSTKRDIVGLNFGQSCFAEFNSTDPFENALTVAHELGHGLGLGHSAANTLMAGDGVSRTSLLQQFEIDTVNQTDE